MKLVIRAVAPEDAEQIVGILNPIITAGHHTVFDKPFSVQAEREYIEQFPERGVFLAAVVLGTYVAEDYKRKGVARRLAKPEAERSPVTTCAVN